MVKEKHTKPIIFLRVTFIFAFLLLSLLTTIPVRAATGRQTGIATSTSLLWVNEERLNQRLQDIQKLGAKWIRIEFNWAEIQSDRPAHYNWEAYDRVVKTAREYNLYILATLAYTPSWARNPNCNSLFKEEEAARKCSPGNTIEFARFARAVVLRYKDHGIHTWEIWNEPNITGYWKTVRNGTVIIDPEAYARTANIAAMQIKHYQPDSFVITGGLAPVFEPNRRGMRQSDFLRKSLQTLEPRLFDAIGIHPYCWPKFPSLAANYNAFYTVDNGDMEYNLQKILHHTPGWGSKQIWATEFGASTVGTRIENEFKSISPDGRPDHVTEINQAKIIGQALRQWHKKKNVGPIFVHSDSDEWLWNRSNENGFGLRRSNGSKKPAYEVFRANNSLINPH